MIKKRKGYIYVDVELSDSVKVNASDVMDEIDDDDLLDEVNDRGLLTTKDEYEKPIPKDGMQLRKLLCDICDLSYHSSDSNILDGIKERLV